MSPTLETVRVPRRFQQADSRTIAIALMAMAIGAVAAGLVELLTALIAFFTNLAYYGRLSAAPLEPAGHGLGSLAMVVPVVGGLIIGVMARFGSPAIRGHGIPEAMEQVITNRSRIPARITFLKPLSAAVAIGTGGPFGAEGPIIATGGALGSLVGQVMRTTAVERKTLLAAGAAAGMAATFGTPVAAVLLSIELLLFEFRPRSLAPVALACFVATAIRIALHGSEPVFRMPDIAQPGSEALGFYALLGILFGLAALGITRAVYRVEDWFERLPVHWMWWPAIGGIAVGVIGLVEPLTLGVGYGNIEQLLSGGMVWSAVAILGLLKFTSWVIALGSGTSGGTLAPILTVGGALGSILGIAGIAVLPAAGIDPRVAALIGMAAVFAGCSHAPLASMVFAFEATRQPLALLPLLAGCATAFLVAVVGQQTSIMTEKMARRGLTISPGLSADYLEHLLVREWARGQVVTLEGRLRVADVRRWLVSHADGTSHHGFPVVDGADQLIGVVTRRDLLGPGVEDESTIRELVRRDPIVVYADSSLREAADHMARENVGRLPVVTRADPRRIVGIITRSDLLNAHAHRLDESGRAEQGLFSELRMAWRKV